MLRAFTVSKPVSLVISMTVFNIISLVIFALGGIFSLPYLGLITPTRSAHKITAFNDNHALCTGHRYQSYYITYVMQQLLHISPVFVRRISAAESRPPAHTLPSGHRRPANLYLRFYFSGRFENILSSISYIVICFNRFRHS